MNRRSILVGLLALAMLALALPASASATWGGHCTTAEHCYGVAEWEMTGKGEEVKGLSSVIYTSGMYVPNVGSSFVDNEQWASFPQRKNYWVEDGQEAGLENCCSLHPFYAYDNKSGYHETDFPWTVEGYTWNSYTLEDPENNGTWCARYGPSETWGCMSGFPKYAKRVEVGAELADESKPENSGKDQTGVLHLNGLWEHWNAAYWVSTDSEECVGGFEDIAGYINWWTC
jgi:hypothetical protein